MSALKGPQNDPTGAPLPIANSVLAVSGAYHQFNALEYKSGKST